MKTHFLSIFSLFLSAMIIVSCGSKKTEESDSSTEFDAAQSGGEGDVAEELEELTELVPSPAEIPWLLHATGADYNGDFINPISNVDNYLTTEDVKSLNMGVYIADMGYLVAYEKTQTSIDYLQGSKKLADELNVTTEGDMAMYETFEANLDNKDTLYNMINSWVDNIDKMLETSKRNNVAALLTTGGFIEGLYIATQLIKTYPTDILAEDQVNLILTPLIRVVLDQEKNLDNLVRLASTSSDDPKVSQLIDELKVLQSQYKSLNIDDQIANNRNDLILNDETLKEITAQVEKMRTEIVSS